MRTLPNRSALFALAFFAAASCSTISTYDNTAYEHAVNAKVDTLALMDKATGGYSDHQKEIDALTTELDKAYEYDRGRPLNRVTVTQWNVLRDPNGPLLGSFLKLWKARGTLGERFIDEKKGKIAEAFDQIIQLESGKLKRPQT